MSEYQNNSTKERKLTNAQSVRRGANPFIEEAQIHLFLCPIDGLQLLEGNAALPGKLCKLYFG